MEALDVSLPSAGECLIASTLVESRVHALILAPSTTDGAVFVAVWAMGGPTGPEIRGPAHPVPHEAVAGVVAGLSDVDWRGAAWRTEDHPPVESNVWLGDGAAAPLD